MQPILAPEPDFILDESPGISDINGAIRALVLLPSPAPHMQRVVIVDTRHPTFGLLDWNAVATALAEANIVALTDIEARKVGFHPATPNHLERLRNEGVLVEDIRRSTIQLAAENIVSKYEHAERAADDVMPIRTLNRRKRLAMRVTRG